ncbi:hypothetical protein RQM47_16255 [Rubrivirga sp. S365]|uniref:hypothetical protein n=1 Tax=Rubrivirga sp. S365 TaxID=3076080 RepID=UPI0028C864A8|nr:hypothetical protein [Rubrivirga sp. S365]MDT7858202.1 hypothetical protein [Rubrivirga sp. S365]
MHRHSLPPPRPPKAARPRSTHRARWLLVPLGLLLLAPNQEAKAQWAVIDPAHIAKSVWNGRQIVQQLQAQRAQVNAFVQNVQKLRSYNLRDVTGFVDAVDRTLLSATNVAYNSSSLVGDFDAFYRGADPTATAATAASWTEGELGGALGTLRSIREHAVQIRAARPDLAAFQRQLTSATTAQQVAEAQGTIEAYAVQESQLLRQATLLQIDQAARAQASAAARRAYVVDVGRTAKARTLQSASAMTGRDYNATGIF